MAGPATVFREIHQLRTYLHELQESLDRQPRTHKAQLARLAKAEADLAALADGLKNAKVTAASKEKALKAKHDLIARYEEQLGSLVAKKEYDAKKLEIAFAQAECSKLEEEALAAMEEAEAIPPRLPDAEKALAAVKADVQRFEAEMAGRKALWEKEKETAQAKLKEVEPQVPAAMRQAFDKTVKTMGHEGFAEVAGRTCGGCQGELTLQQRLTLESGGYGICLSCGCILYLPASKAGPEE
ncbi:MAG: hypothetical protein K2W96_23995 [Gemmataceae bacterium]|nr:hypothetical protein [Gemmataceae bacterium]